jgi:hypothetical protein
MSDYLSPGVYIDEFEMGAKLVEGVSTSTAGFVGVTDKTGFVDGDGETVDYKNKAIFVSSWGDFVSKFGRWTEAAPHMAPAIFSFFTNGGNRCYVVSVEDGGYVGTDGGPDARTGLQALNEVDDVSIVVIPGITDTAVQLAMITHCETMKDRFCIFDSAKEETMELIIARKNTLESDSGYGALYYPWIEISVEKDIANEKVELKSMFVPPSGAIAGIYARSDSERGVHKAPANEVLRGVTRLEFNLTNTEQNRLNPIGVNCLRSFTGRGIRVWGARTISSGSSWRYVNVRRLFIYLEESIDESTQWVVFEPNNERLWARVKQTISNFLTRAWKDGALMGTTPEEAFYVKCDKDTMSPGQIAEGKLIVEIGVAAAKPAEFVIFRIAQWTGSSNN